MNNPKVQNYERNLNFMEVYQLTERIKSKKKKFLSFKNRVCDQIQSSMNFSKMSKVGQKMHWQLNNMYKCRDSKKWQELVQ